jgi:hypothetical protein
MISTFTYEEGLWRQIKVLILLAESDHNFLCWELLVFLVLQTQHGVEKETRGVFGFFVLQTQHGVEKETRGAFGFFGATNTTWC